MRVTERVWRCMAQTRSWRERLRMRPKKDASAPQSYFCLGIIKYADADGGASKNGILLYVKPGLRGDEPPDIASYAMAQAALGAVHTTHLPKTGPAPVGWAISFGARNREWEIAMMCPRSC